MRPMLPETTTDFEIALSDVADFLSDARNLERRGNLRRAQTVYAVAEGYAFRSGFLELIRLVWAYAPTPPRSFCL